MGNFADTSLFQLYYVEEDTFGTTPTSAKMTEFRTTGEGINYGVDFTESVELRSDRQIPDLVQVDASVAGPANYEVSYGSHDDIFQAALFSTWTTSVSIATSTDIAATATGASGYPEFFSTSTDFKTSGVGAIASGMWINVAGFASAVNNGLFHVRSVPTSNSIAIYEETIGNEAAGAGVTMVNDGMLQNGTTKRSFTVEKYMSDIGMYQAFQGCRVGKLSMNFEAGSILNGSFEFMGLGSTGEITSASVGTGTTATTTNDVMNAVSDLSNVQVDGSSPDFSITNLTIELDNGLREQKAIGTLGAVGIGAGRSNVAGTISIYMSAEAAAVYNNMINNVSFRFNFKLTDGDGNIYIFSFYRTKIKDPNLVAGGIDQDMMFEGGLQFIMDSGSVGYTMQIDRFNA